MRFRMTRGADNAALQAQIHDPELKLDDAAARVQMNTARIAALREQLSGFSVIPSNDYTAEAKRSELTQQLADSVQALKKATLEQIRSQTIVSYLQQYRQPLIEKGCEAFLAERFCPAFYGYSYMEDVDLSVRVAKRWRLVVHTGAAMYHDTGPSRFKAPYVRARMSVANRYHVMTRSAVNTSSTSRSWSIFPVPSPTSTSRRSRCRPR